MSAAGPPRPVLHVVVCAAGPALHAVHVLRAAVRRGWDVWTVPTPAALEFFDATEAETVTGHPARARWRRPGEEGSLPDADALLAAPATYNTINKWASGIADTYALGRLAEATGRRVPVVVLPSVNAALAGNSVYGRSLRSLRADGVQVLDGSGWDEALDAVSRPRPPSG